MGFREDLQQAKQDMADTATSVDAVVADVDRLHAKILELENSPDRVTVADQTLITEMLSMSTALKSSVKALDDKTAEPAPPPPPPEEPPTETEPSNG